jgi:outer membrane protein assembly factor BamB
MWAVGESGSFQVNAIATDAFGNVIVTGALQETFSESGYYTVEYDSAGARRWTAQRSDFGSFNWALANAVDDGGNVYVTGRFMNPPTFSEYLTVKYDVDGNESWTAAYSGGPPPAYAIPVALRVDTKGHVFVTGRTELPTISSEFATVKYSQDLAGQANGY